MNLSEYKRWRALLHKVIAKQSKKNKLILCAYTKWKSMKESIINTQNEYKTTSKKQTDKKKTDLFFVFCKCVYIPRKQVQDRSKKYLGNKNNINKKKDLLEKPQSQ